jgi:hypothetical protein
MNMVHAIAFPVALLVGAFMVHGASGQSPPPTVESGNSLVKVAVESSVETIHPGDRFLLAFHFEIAPHWHIYWRNPGESGAPTMIEVTGPEGFEMGEIIWQRPILIPGEFTTYGYEDEATLFVPVKAPESLGGGEVTFEAAINWLVCQESCLLGDAAIEIAVGTSSSPPPDPLPSAKDDAHPFAAYRIESTTISDLAPLVPDNLANVLAASITREGSILSITGPANGATLLAWFPSHSPGVSASIVKQRIEDDCFTLVLRFEVNPTATLGEPPVAGGVIALGAEKDAPSYAFEVALDN